MKHGQIGCIDPKELIQAGDALIPSYDAIVFLCIVKDCNYFLRKMHDWSLVNDNFDGYWLQMTAFDNYWINLTTLSLPTQQSIVVKITSFTTVFGGYGTSPSILYCL